MNRQKTILLIAALLLICSGAAVLARIKNHQRLGMPGVKTESLAGSPNLRVIFPEHVLNYVSKEIGIDQVVTNTLPADTSYGQRHYLNPQDRDDQIHMTAVLMGTDRTSIHKPQYCLEGAGWKIDNAFSHEMKIPVAHPLAYELPVIKLVATRTMQNAGGQPTTYRGVYVYWFVADGALSGDMSGRERMWWMARHLLRTGELQRWAYISCFAVCPPGHETATFERMKKFIATSVPEFQLTPKPGAIAATRP